MSGTGGTESHLNRSMGSAMSAIDCTLRHGQVYVFLVVCGQMPIYKFYLQTMMLHISIPLVSGFYHLDGDSP